MVYRTEGDFRKAVEKRLGRTISLVNWGKVAARLTRMGFHEPISDRDTDMAARYTAKFLKGMKENSLDETKLDLSGIAGE